MDKILVTPKINTDLDGTSCALAYADLLNKTGKSAEAVIFGEPQSEVQYFVKDHGIQISTQPDGKTGSWDEFILVDASSMKGMPKIVDPNKVVEIIDHRTGEPEKEFPNAKIQNDLIGAAATIVVERFIEAKLKPQPDHAKLLYGAIYHNTLNFIATNASERDRKAAKFLEKEFGLNGKLIREMFDFATRRIEQNPKQALQDDAKEFGEGYLIGAYQLIVWGAEVFKQKSIIEETIGELSKKFNVDWSFLNIVDLETKKSTIYCSDKVGQDLLTKASGCNFENGWSELDRAWLRKQIMPKINELL
ncbi:MAG: DHH family phosphoesterase [Patescibacteria group bacterium]